jgi:hypothetical protein
MAQLAVEWLATYLKSITFLNCDEVIQQAKEMEKQQMMSFANWCRIHDKTHQNEIWTIWQLFDKYNNETFKK